MKKIFAYGTLKGRHWNNRLFGDSEFLGEFMTTPNYDLLANGIPYLREQGEYSVGGEVYLCSDDVVARLDQLEGHPRWYNRRAVEIQGLEDVQGYVYPHEIDAPACRTLNEHGVIIWQG